MGTYKKSDLIKDLHEQTAYLDTEVVRTAVDHILVSLLESLSERREVQIRGFGTFKTHFRKSHMGFNPIRGQSSNLEGRFVAHFKPSPLMHHALNRVDEDS